MTVFKKAQKVLALRRHIQTLKERALESRADAPKQNPITIFACEPHPAYVFGTGIQMVPSTSSTVLQAVRQRLTGNCDELPDLGDPGLSNSFRAPLKLRGWSTQSPAKAKAKATRRCVARVLMTETVSSPIIRSWSTYYGPGQAMILAVLDLTKPPFEKATERTLDSSLKRTLCRTLDRSLDHDPKMRKRLVDQVFDDHQGFWVPSNCRSSSSSSCASPSSLLLGDRSVHVDEDNLATLRMSLIVEGPVRGKDPKGNPWARLEADPELWRGLPTCLAATSLSELCGSDIQALHTGDVLPPKILSTILNNMLIQLAMELELPDPLGMEADKVFPRKLSALQMIRRHGSNVALITEMQ
ncbi:hypothetical protein PG985_013545 [Apiospora marii]|uniref:uncharacterized protein n=1 Tax=Apiospora marii TaxID=335849 RepID=UPI00312FBE9C